MYLINYYSDRGYRTMESTTNQKSITRPKNRGQEWKYDSNIPQNSGRSPLVMLKFIFKGQLGSPGSFAGNPGGVRVGPCLATGLAPRCLPGLTFPDFDLAPKRNEVWLLGTGFGIAPMNKLVSLTWLLWALRSFRSFTLHYITSLNSS